MNMAAPRKDVDRIKLGVDYRANVKSLRTLGKEYGLAASRISQIAVEEGWERDLAQKIKEKAKVKLNKAILNAEDEQRSVSTEKEVVEANAEMQTQIILGQRSLIVRYREMIKKMLLELEETTGQPEEFASLGELMAAPDERGVDKLNEIYRKVISLPQRIDGLKKLAETLKILIALERQAFGVDDGPDNSGKDDIATMSRRELEERARGK